MPDLFHLSFDAVICSGLTCLLLREAMIAVLPDHIAGPGGSFIDTSRD